MTRLLVSLVRLYPPGFRQRFGAEMAAVLTESAYALRPSPPARRLARKAWIAADLLAGAGWEWWHQAAATVLGSPGAPAWTELRSASPQRTSVPKPPPFTPLPELRRRHAGRSLPARAPTMV